jgi:hypothetical protein
LNIVLRGEGEAAAAAAEPTNVIFGICIKDIPNNTVIVIADIVNTFDFCIIIIDTIILADVEMYMDLKNCLHFPPFLSQHPPGTFLNQCYWRFEKG